MKKIEFKNLPSKETPLSASNLNLLQQNIEDEFNTLNSYFEIPQGDNRRRWVKIAEFSTNLTGGDNRIQMRIYGTIRYGSNKPGMDMIEISARGGMNISIYAFNHTANNDNQRYGYVNRADGKTELWIDQGTYNYRSKVEIINADNCVVKLFEIKYEQPAGLVAIDKEIVATEKSVLSVYNNQTGNIRIDGKNDIRIDDELLFELPKNWQWTKLGRICDKLVDGDHNPPKGIEEKTEYIMVSSRNINHNTVEDLENVRYLTKEMFEAENLRTNATAGDILFTSVGSLGRSCIYDGSMNICFQRSVSILNTKVYNKYVKIFFDSNFYQNYVAEHATGTAQMGFYLQEMAESFIAIPPISEQKRIVTKVEEIFNALDDIQSNLV